MFRAICVCFALSGALLSACRQDTETRGARYTSPQAVWDAYRYALHRGRWKEAFQCLTPEAQEQQVLGLIVIAAYLGPTAEKATADKLKAILERHGLDVEQIEAGTARMEDADAADYVEELTHRVEDAESVFVEAMSVLDRVMPRPKGKYWWSRVVERGELKEMDIAESQARGKYIRKLDEGEVFDIGGVRQTEMEDTAEFRKVDGRWLVHGRG